MLNEFVEKILIHERARKGSQDTTQEIEIYFNFVGKYVPPQFGKVTLTPEEQEELRKKEERKDRLHQNYLRRKANGKQKEYEERIKAAKKGRDEGKENGFAHRGYNERRVYPSQQFAESGAAESYNTSQHCSLIMKIRRSES